MRLLDYTISENETREIVLKSAARRVVETQVMTFDLVIESHDLPKDSQVIRELAYLPEYPREWGGIEIEVHAITRINHENRYWFLVTLARTTGLDPSIFPTQ